MKKIILFTLVCFFTLTGVGFPGMQRDKAGMKLPAGKWWRIPRIVQASNIMPEEQSQLDSLYVQNRRKMIDLKSVLEKELFELELVFDVTSFDADACMDRYRKVQNARTTLALERFKFVVEVRKLMGFERFQQLKEKYRHLRQLRKRLKKE
ncbi:MAG: hypothetical protein V3S66_09500 [Desulfobacterales bacterium]